jgi:hypothetical protein
MPEEKKYRLDKTAFAAQTAEQADNHYAYWKNKTPHERLDAAFYLINRFYGITPKTKLDRSVFSKRKHSA